LGQRLLKAAGAERLFGRNSDGYPTTIQQLLKSEMTRSTVGGRSDTARVETAESISSLFIVVRMLISSIHEGVAQC
jgi:hypothetical protein